MRIKNGLSVFAVISALASAVYLGIGIAGGSFGGVALSASSSPRFWPPQPQNMVFVDGTVTFQTGGAATIYQVPAGKWFVATSASTGTGRSLVEDLGGVVTVKVGTVFLGQGGSGSESNGMRPQVEAPLGVVFRPGSQVQISGAGVSSLGYSLGGYLVTDDAVSVPGAWPPHPRDMVFFDSESLPGFDPNNGHPLAPFSFISGYTVPADKSFVVTGFWLKGASQGPAVSLAEEFGGVAVSKVSGNYIKATYSGTGVTLPLNLRAPLGISFSSGSSVVVNNPGGLQVFQVFFGFSGYLVDA
jgi:hypothetical protein